jgi:hypothetical protein
MSGLGSFTQQVSQIPGQARIYLGPFGPFGPGSPGFSTYRGPHPDHKRGSHREPPFDEILRLRQLKPLKKFATMGIIHKILPLTVKLSKNSPPAVKIVKYFASYSWNC